MKWLFENLKSGFFRPSTIIFILFVGLFYWQIDFFNALPDFLGITILFIGLCAYRAGEGATEGYTWKADASDVKYIIPQGYERGTWTGTYNWLKDTYHHWRGIEGIGIALCIFGCLIKARDLTRMEVLIIYVLALLSYPLYPYTMDKIRGKI